MSHPPSEVALLSCAIGGVLLALDHLLLNRVFRPLGYFLCGEPAPSQEARDRGDLPARYSMLEKKFAVWLECLLLHIIEVAVCFHYALRWTWWRDLGAWPLDVLQPLLDAEKHEQERNEIAPFYVGYLGYVIYTFVRDVFLKENRTGGNVAFTVHHVITLFLTGVSFFFGEWRAGFLTRLCLGLGDVTLYFGKCYSAREQVGNGSRLVLGSLFFINFVIWAGMRVLGYGYLCYSLTVMYTRERSNWATDQWMVASSMLLGSWALLCLQCVWTPIILSTCFKYFRTGTFVDPVHREHLQDSRGKQVSKSVEVDDVAETKKGA